MPDQEDHKYRPDGVSDIDPLPQCRECNERLTMEEYEEFEDICYDCVNGETQGILSDNPYRRLR